MGQGTAKDSSKALKYYEDASNKGYAKQVTPLHKFMRLVNWALPKIAINSVNIFKRHQLKVLMMQLWKLRRFYLLKKPQSHQIALQKLAPLIRKGNYPAIQVKALYDISQGVENKNPLMKRQGIEALQSIAQKAMPCFYGFSNHDGEWQYHSAKPTAG